MTFAGAWNKPAQEYLDCWRWIDEQFYDQEFFVFNFQEVVDRFGRFPQRNKVLGRENTPEEEEWLNNLPDKFKWWSIHRVLLNGPLILSHTRWSARNFNVWFFSFTFLPFNLNQLRIDVRHSICWTYSFLFAFLNALTSINKCVPTFQWRKKNVVIYIILLMQVADSCQSCSQFFMCQSCYWKWTSS